MQLISTLALATSAAALVASAGVAILAGKPALDARDAVDALAEELDGRVDVAPCMVDRICTERAVAAGAVDVGTEPYEGEVVILHTPAGAAPFPVGAFCVCVVR